MGLGGSSAGVLLGDPRVHARGHRAAGELSGFSPAHADGLEVWFRASAGRMPDVLEIGVRGRRHPRVEAYWDGCSFAL